MSLFWKRLGILFSVALNFGFIGMAIFMAYQYSTPRDKHERFSQELVAMVRDLQLPETKEKNVLEKIETFNAFINEHKRNIRQTRGDVLRCLAENGPLDRDRLHHQCVILRNLIQDRDAAFEAHATELRALMGDKKGAEFFGLLYKQLQSTRHVPD